MLGGKSTTRTTVVAPKSSSGADTDSESRTCTLVSIMELFHIRELLPPVSAVALQPARLQRRSNAEQFMAEEEEDYVVQTLRSAPLSFFRGSVSSNSSGDVPLFPPPLEKTLVPNSTTPASVGKKPSSTEAAASECARKVSAASSSTSAAVALSSLTEVLSMLNLIFQRSPAALGKSGNYAKLLRLLMEHDFVAHAVSDMEELWWRCARRSAAPSSSANLNAFTALALYCDVLLLLACHNDISEKNSASVGKCAADGSSANAPAASSSSPFASSASLVKLYALNQEMGAMLTDAAAPPALLRRSVASLTAFLIHCATQLPEEVRKSALSDLEKGGAGARANMAHMAFIAALPSACPAMSQEWQCRALEVVREATLYDADVHVAYCTDGPTSVVLDVAVAKFGGAMHGLLSIMSESAWCYCTADALTHICHAVGLYGGAWETYPPSYVNLVNFLHRALLRYRAAYETHLTTLPRGSSGVEGATRVTEKASSLSNASSMIVHANRGGTHNAVSRLYGRSMESLLDSAILGVTNPEGDHKAGVPSFAENVDVRDDGAHKEEQGGPTAYLLRCEAYADSPRNFLFYLSLLAYVTSALPPLLNSLEELPLFFALSSSTSAVTDGRVASEREGAAAAGTAPRNADISLFSLCVELLRENLSLVVSARYDHTSHTERQRCLLCEATMCLLSAFMCEFPHSIQRLEMHTGALHLVHTVSYVVTTIVNASAASFQMKRAAYALLYRYGSAVESLQAVLAQLMSTANWAALSGDAEYVQADFSESVELYKYLCCTHEDVGAAEMGRALVAVAEMPVGAFRCVVGGAAVAAIAVHAVFGLWEVALSERELFGAVTVAQLPQLYSRLGEALDTLMQAQRSGCWMTGGRSSWRSARVTAWLLYNTTSLYRAPAALTAATFPVPSTREEAAAGAVFNESVATEAPGRRPRSLLEVCLGLMCDKAYQPAHRWMAELLVAAMQTCAEHQRAQQVFQAMRSTLSSAEVARLREMLLTVQEGGNVGTVSNLLRLEVWLAMVRWCPALFVLLFGPEKQSGDSEDEETNSEKGRGRDSANGASSSDSDAATAEAQPENLPFAKLLGATIRAKEASLQEKAIALQVLRHTGLSTVIEIKDVAALLLKSGSAKNSEKDAANTSITSSATAAAPDQLAGEWEVSMLAVACITYVTTAISRQLSRAKDAAVTGSADSSGHDHERASSCTTGARTPLRRPTLAPLATSLNTAAAGASPVATARSKVLTDHADTIDQLLRHAQVIMNGCRTAYERESRKVSYEDVFEWLSRHEGNVSSCGEGLSASVVLPRRSRVWRGAARGVENSFGVEGSALLSRTTPSALSTASSRVSSLHTSKAPLPLLSLSTGQLASILPYHRLVPVGPAEARFFRDTGEDRRLNHLATLLDSAADMATAVEQLLWLSNVDNAAAGLFSKRTQSLLELALNAVVASRPNCPLLAPLLTRHVQNALHLAKAATTVLESSLGNDMMELDVSPSIPRVMLELAAFVRVNRVHTFLLVDAVSIVTALPLNSLPEQAAVEELMRDMQAVLHEQLVAPMGKNGGGPAFHFFDAMVESCARYFGRQRPDGSGPVDTVLVARLLPTLMRYASLLSQLIQPTQPACENVYRFAGVLECVSCILAYAGKHMVVLAFIPEDLLLGFTRALGQFAFSSVYDHATQRHRRLSWHVCWHAVLSLWCVIVSLRGPFDAKGSGWMPSLKSALESIPRFGSAIGVFSGGHGADRQALLVWELEEVDLATRLTAMLAIQDVLLFTLMTSVQAGFLFLQQPRLQQRCVASLPTSEASAGEGRRIVAAQAHALRNALTVLLKQPYYVFPRDGASLAAFVFLPELLNDPSLKSISGGAAAERGGITAKCLVFSLDLLRQFTVRELQLLRRITASAAVAGAQERSPDVSRTSGGSVASRESSVGRSPCHAPLGDGETVTEAEELYTADGVVEDSADQQAIHLETVQLALNAYVLSVEDLLNNAPHAPGGFYTSAAMQTIRHTTERLLHTLRSLAREVRDLRRPLFSQIVQSKTTQLQAVLERL
ncbi:hypothetical protein ABL78_0313 [Leptomonas seymouri]|uniref:Uncharacterized protein n=1 Tax=Leptomonas seymouri TaxID=5684 RepID=A0A0N1IMK3_LEPSE|nr:hypothetical protein ABL78_0313 [Leptomonas seymouri]|eukprot:KPI90553.1 hypothetical protein ABL78_0313 [Leptomonas seymouri]